MSKSILFGDKPGNKKYFLLAFLTNLIAIS